MPPFFVIESVERGGFFIRPLAILLQAILNKFFGMKLEDWSGIMGFLYKIQALDLKINYGILSYDIQISARKNKSL